MRASTHTAIGPSKARSISGIMAGLIAVLGVIALVIVVLRL